LTISSLTERSAPPRGKHYLAIVADREPASIVSLVREILESEPESRVTLVYGNRDSSSVPFREELLDLKDRNLARLALLFVMSDEPHEVELLSGRIDRAKVDALLDSWIDAESIDIAFVSGPQDMTEAALASLEAHGVARRNIETEGFFVDVRTPPPAAANASALAGEVRASALLDGRRHEFAIEREGERETILDAGLRQGLDLPYSCKGGVCSTCRVLLVEGEVDMEIHYALDDDEIARGFILMCQSYPRSDTIAIDVDAHGQL
jgi:ring-1,2-phenylacetyl-CoA epoxidase subunit PaaE